jgi:hypothetical protein
MVGIFRDYFIHWLTILCHTWMVTYKIWKLSNCTPSAFNECDNLDFLTSYPHTVSFMLRYAGNHFLRVLSVLSLRCSDYVCDSELITFKIFSSEKLKNQIQWNQISVVDISILMLVLWLHIAEWKVMSAKAQCHDAKDLVFFVLPYTFQDLKIECFLFYLCWRNSFVGNNFFGIRKANQNVFDFDIHALLLVLVEVTHLFLEHTKNPDIISCCFHHS